MAEVTAVSKLLHTAPLRWPQLAFKSTTPCRVRRGLLRRSCQPTRYVLEVAVPGPTPRPPGQAGALQRGHTQAADSILTGLTASASNGAGPGRASQTPAQEGGQHHDIQLVSRQHTLPDGCFLELLEVKPVQDSLLMPQTGPPLLFVHGANHAAWCWAAKFLPHLGGDGHHALAVSLRGHGSSGDRKCKDKYRQSIDDLAHVISCLSQPPVLVAHSMGGFFAQRYLIELANKQKLPEVAGVVMMSAAALTAAMPDAKWWQSQKSILHGFRCFWWMTTFHVFKSKQADKEMLFSQDLPDDWLQRYHTELHNGHKAVPISFKELQAFLPEVESARQAAKSLSLPIGVMISGDDAVIMPHQVRATAEYFGVEAIVLPGLAHDVMLDTRWHIAAQTLEDWLQSHFSVIPGSTTYEQQASSSQQL